MKIKSIVLIACALAWACTPCLGSAAQLVTNGDFETGTPVFGASPAGWNATVSPENTGQFAPGGLQSPLVGSVAFLQSGSRILQTFAGVKLQPGTKYTVSFDAYISVGGPPAFLETVVCYGSGSGVTSAFDNLIVSTDLVRGSQRSLASLTSNGQHFSYTFVTKTIIDGFTGSTSDLAIYLQTAGIFAPYAAQLYLDNVAVTTTAATAAELAPHDGGLITNGDFNTGGSYFGASPTGWNTTVGAAGTGQFVPGDGPPAPLSGKVAYMGGGTQMFQTFAGVKLQPSTEYTVTFDASISVGIPTAYLFADMSYGTGSGGTSGFGGSISNSDLIRGNHGYFAPLSNSGQRFSYTFVTKTVAEGFTGSASDIALYIQPSTGFDGVTAAQLYFDNISVIARPVTLAELVTNGDFETGVDPEPGIFGASPTGWNTTVGTAGTGQFLAGGAQAPLNNVVAYMGGGSQMFQTFSGVKLLPGTTYLISYDAYISVGNPPAYLFSDVSYGTGSGGTSGFNGSIAESDLLHGAHGFFASVSGSGQHFDYSFTTKSVADGFAGSASDMAIYVQPSIGFDGITASQCYIDNVSVIIAVPVAIALPTLAWTQTGNTLTLTWPLDVINYTLESAGDVNSTTWTNVPGVVTNSVTVSMNGGCSFFRLKKNP